MKKEILFISFLILLLVNKNLFGKLTLQEIRTASNNIIVLYFTSDTINVNEVNIEKAEDWKINGKPAINIYRYATQADVFDHYVYLKTRNLKEGKKYLIETPYIKREFLFKEKDVLCESIKTNQVGYSALSNKRYANFAIWLGTGGSQMIEGNLPDFEVVENNTGNIVSKGKFTEFGLDSSSGDYVYRIDLSEVKEGGPYKIVVKGYGSSYPFGVGGEFSKKLAYISFRGQYLQRCGCPIEKPDIRKKACHTLVYDVGGPIGEANIIVNGDEPTFKCYGGYHDAGDADRRAYHIINPIINLMIYEAFPESFEDGQFDIPGEFDDEFNIKSYTNEIPDIIDEAEWGTLIWEYLQKEDGSIYFGTETKGYPDPFDAPMDLDNKKYGTVKTDPRATCPNAALFMHLARILQPYKPERTEMLLKRAEKAMEYGEADIADPEKLYFYIQKYLLTGDETAHKKVRELYTIADSLKYYLYITHGYSLNDIHFDNPAYIYSYIIEKEKPTDKNIVEFFTKAIKEAADSCINMLNSHAYPVGTNSDGGGWGRNVRQPQYATCPMLYWKLTGEQKYLDAAAELLNYKIGLNPQGLSYVTQLGFHQVHNPHDRESAYTKKLGWGTKPGITVFGPGITGRWIKPAVIPSVEGLSKERQFADDIRLIYYTEFTIFETMSHDAFYTVLAEGGKWNGEDPYKNDE
ncbi:MAG: glycoside hydrolase family 9 protein [Bacteroidales bacterium]|nr:glycoside hydrolase family 9 protein [Bacteroidales bacterium]